MPDDVATDRALAMTARSIRQRKRGGGPRAIAASLAATTRDIFQKRGFADGAILKDWPTIAGEHLARHTRPEKITHPKAQGTGGTLYLTIENGSIALELQHLQPLLIERINGFFGFKAVERLKITQGPLPASGERPAWQPRDLEKGEEANLAESLMDVQDDDLRRALENLGRAVLARRPGAVDKK
ncbi:MAG: DciA family protein [Proteobacteria bacterium]|nr:DciA family protein [Pseudomonadota bacterium]MDA1022350.1 DciA family protein [Pseudomonadota bacterium]